MKETLSPDIGLKVTDKLLSRNKHKDVLTREVEDALMIGKVNSILCIMNSKGEWNSGKVAKFILESSDRELKRFAEGIGEQDMKMKKVIYLLKRKRAILSF